MKKKELLIISVLSVLVTIFSSPLKTMRVDYCTYLGFPITNFSTCLDIDSSLPNLIIPGPGIPIRQKTIWSGFLIDYFFWFLVLAVGWWVVKKLKTKK